MFDNWLSYTTVGQSIMECRELHVKKEYPRARRLLKGFMGGKVLQ